MSTSVGRGGGQDAAVGGGGRRTEERGRRAVGRGGGQDAAVGGGGRRTEERGGRRAVGRDGPPSCHVRIPHEVSSIRRDEVFLLDEVSPVPVPFHLPVPAAQNVRFQSI